MSFRRAVGQGIFGDGLVGVGLRRSRQPLGWRSDLARDITSRIGRLLQREERLPRSAIEEKDKARLGRLGDGIDPLAVARDRQQRWGRGKIAVPKVVVHSLKMPDAFAGLSVKGEQCIGKQVVSYAIAAIEVEDG